MSKLVLNGDVSGSVTLDAPSVSGTTTLTLPTTSGTVLTSASNTNFPAGSVLQVVQGVYSTGVSNSTTTLADTGLTATITPKSATSKILVIVNQNGGVKAPGNTNNSIRVVLQRNGTIIATASQRAGLNAVSADYYLETVAVTYLDSPATTSATTYKTQFANFVASSIVFLQLVGETSTITLMEIAG
jgi:hypothetical protein